MPLNRGTTRTFHLRLYATEMESITLLKRNDDQQQVTVRSVVLYNCRRSKIHKMGQTIQGDMVSNHRTTWHIPRIELERTGVNFITPLDRIVQNDPMLEKGWRWQPESTTEIRVKLFANHICVDCLKVDPPNS